ncbi:tetratricopeptide repeat protein, partial [Glaesserella parasuis]
MKLNKTLLSTLLLSFAIAGNVYAETAEEKFDRAVQYAEQQNYQAAFPMFKELAEQGYAVAQFNLGVMYDKGQGVNQDYHQAAKWFQKAAEQGHAVAQFNLGNMYYNGQGVDQDYHQAAKWFQKAA